MIDVFDRVPTQPNKMKITHEDGTIEYVVMERADEPIADGTPINRALFNSIKSGNDLVQKYNVAQFEKLEDEIIYLTLPNTITEYEMGMRVLITPEEQFEYTEVSPIPVFSSGATSANGFSIIGTMNSSSYPNNKLSHIFDKNASTKGTFTKELVLNFPYAMRIHRIKLHYSMNGTLTVYGIKPNGSLVEIFKKAFTGFSTFNNVATVDNDEIFVGIMMITSTSDNLFYEVDIVAADVSIYNLTRSNYLNINNLGNVLINGNIVIGRKYELVYDGTVFNAMEVVYNV